MMVLWGPDDTEACPVYVKLATSKCLLHLHWLNIGKLVSQSLYSLYTISMLYVYTSEPTTRFKQVF